MSAEQAQKRFEPTPARKEKARREGNVARSHELLGVVAFGGAALGTFAVVPGIGHAAAAAWKELAEMPDTSRLPPALAAIAAAALVPLCAAAAAAGAAGLAQGGGLRFVVPKVQYSRLAPLAGLKRMAGGEALLAATRACVAFGVATAAMWPVAYELFARATSAGTPGAFATLVGDAARRAFASAVVVGAAFAAADYALAHRRWRAELKMTLEELKRDHKETEGDPHARSRRKQLHRSLARGAIAQTKDAAFIVVNPSHIAIALRYAPPAIPVPTILVRAADEGARQVRAIAAARRIPVIENVALARALYAGGEAGRVIPSRTFVAVAQVIAELVRAGVLT